MMSRLTFGVCLSTAVALAASCTDGGGLPAGRPIETGFAFTNLSRHAYAQLEIRMHDVAVSGGEFYRTPLLPPGATVRERFLETIGEACPAGVDLRLLLFERINAGVPIGLDAGEAVAPDPIAAGAIADVPACTSVVVETYTIVNWDAPIGSATVKIAQGTPLESVIRSAGLFPNADSVWAFEGVSSDLVELGPQPLVVGEGIAGRVIGVAGGGIEGVGVLIRSRFRTRLSDLDPENDPDAGFGEPIDFTLTDEEGAFRFDRPGGAYRIEVFSDDFLFRPAIVDLETPSDTLIFVAEPLS